VLLALYSTDIEWFADTHTPGYTKVLPRQVGIVLTSEGLHRSIIVYNSISYGSYLIIRALSQSFLPPRLPSHIAMVGVGEEKKYGASQRVFFPLLLCARFDIR